MNTGRELLEFCKKKSAVVLSYGLTSGDFHAESVKSRRAEPVSKW